MNIKQKEQREFITLRFASALILMTAILGVFAFVVYQNEAEKTVTNISSVYLQHRSDLTSRAVPSRLPSVSVTLTVQHRTEPVISKQD